VCFVIVGHVLLLLFERILTHFRDAFGGGQLFLEQKSGICKSCRRDFVVTARNCPTGRKE
jgi:hypothetical protein